MRQLELHHHGDDRGSLVALEQDSGTPFAIRRAYYIFDTREGVVRGKHAHKLLKQLLICVSGSCIVDTETSDGLKQSHTLNSATSGLLIEGLVWREMRQFSPGAVLLVLADNVFDENDYIRDYNVFIETSQAFNASDRKHARRPGY